VKKRASDSSSERSFPAYYPVFLNLNGKKTVVVGGGKVAERKIRALLQTKADITVISPEITARIRREEIKGRIRYICRQYKQGDLKNAFLVIAATDSAKINERVSREAPGLVNVVDTPNMCNFIVPSVIKRGPLRIAVSTSGVSPALSRSIRQEIEQCYSKEFSAYLRSLRTIRSEAMKRIKDPQKRGEFLKAVATKEMIGILRGKGCNGAQKAVRQLFSKTKAL
jgi:precorrin-2 dehydrogenase / sirohydrochlorin ferrochelatase